MSQGANQIPTTPPLPGGTLVNDANAALAALLTQYSGASAPSAPSAQQVWVDTSGAPIWVKKVWDGSAWIPELVYDTTNHQAYGPIGGDTATLASAATTDLGSVNASVVTVSGTATITSLGSSMLPGQTKLVVASGAFTLAYNATNLIIPGAQSLTVAAGDSFFATCVSAGNFRIWAYEPNISLVAGLTLANGLNSNIAIANARVLRITGPTGAFSVGGLVLPSTYDGRMITLRNTTAQTMTIVNQDASSSAANRILTLTGGNVVLRATAQSAASFYYDPTDANWILVNSN